MNTVYKLMRGIEVVFSNLLYLVGAFGMLIAFGAVMMALGILSAGLYVELEDKERAKDEIRCLWKTVKNEMPSMFS